jgi:sulfate adenylyltransferase
MINAHGGVLINRKLDKKKSERITKSGLPRIAVSDDVIFDIEKIAQGAYSPLKGFMCKDDLASVVYHMKLSNNTPWTIPIFLPINEKKSKFFSKRDEIILTNHDGVEIALLKVDDIYSFSKVTWARKIYGTDSRAHPGVDRLLDTHNKFMGGNIWLINKPNFKFEKYNLEPAETRKVIEERRWKTIAGFQTRNIPHRAHEYLQKIALTFTDGLLIHPIIGWKKKGDFDPAVIIKSYKLLINNYYPTSSVIFSGLATAMRYAGPREAVFHAIIRKNYGCTHFIVGRDHAGVGDFYDKYDAHRIFDKVPDLEIKILMLREPYFCKKCNEVTTDKICPHREKDHLKISGTKIRKLIASGKDIPEYLLRPEVAKMVSKNKTKHFIA